MHLLWPYFLLRRGVKMFAPVFSEKFDIPSPCQKWTRFGLSDVPIPKPADGTLQAVPHEPRLLVGQSERLSRLDEIAV